MFDEQDKAPQEDDDGDIWADAEIISACSRRQLIEDGELVDLMQGETAALVSAAGFRVPIAITSTAFFQWIDPSEQDRRDGQSINGRLWDLLSVLGAKIRSPGGRDTDRIHFDLSVWKDGRFQTAKLWSHIGPGDTPAPVMTIMLEGED
jgi:hypothetical protein